MVKKSSKWLTAGISLITVTLAASAAKQVYNYSQPPLKKKECDYIYPSHFPILERVKSETSVKFAQIGGTTNDASCLNKTVIYGIIKISSIEEIKDALAFAKENNLKISAAGTQHSMGGQSFSPSGIVLDMKGLNRIGINREQKTLTAQSGATWKQIQKTLDQQGLAVKAMQSINIFTVGGTLSVNAHGPAHDPGPIAPTVKAVRVMTADGEIINASPTENPNLFRHILGGYGLFGIILEADFDVVDNEVYEQKTQMLDYSDFPEFYKNKIEGKQDIGLVYAHLSVSPGSYLSETIVHTFHKTKFEDKLPELHFENHDTLTRLIINFSKTGGIGRWLRWEVEKYFEPKLRACATRNQAMSQPDLCLVTRNSGMYDSMGYLNNRLKDTDILQEYFVSPENMPNFVDGLKEIVQKNKANLLNVTIRIVQKDTVTALPYAKANMLAFVLYFNQKLNDKSSKALEQTTKELVDLALNLKGTFYLPYQLYYSPHQLRQSYPEIDDFFNEKKKQDPELLFSNEWYQKYAVQ